MKANEKYEKCKIDWLRKEEKSGRKWTIDQNKPKFIVRRKKK
jgi:hypothetical protein